MAIGTPIVRGAGQLTSAEATSVATSAACSFTVGLQYTCIVAVVDPDFNSTTVSTPTGGPTWTLVTSVQSGGGDGRLYLFRGVASSTESAVVSAGLSETASAAIQVTEHPGVDTSDPIRNFASNYQFAPGGGLSVSLPAFDAGGANAAFAWCFNATTGGQGAIGARSSWTELTEVTFIGYGGAGSAGLETQYRLATTDNTAEATTGMDFVSMLIAVEFNEAPEASATLDQAAHRVYSNDGSESAATAFAAQNASPTVAASAVIHVRFGIQATGDPGGLQFKLREKNASDGDGEFFDVD